MPSLLNAFRSSPTTLASGIFKACSVDGGSTSGTTADTVQNKTTTTTTETMPRYQKTKKKVFNVKVIAKHRKKNTTTETLETIVKVARDIEKKGTNYRSNTKNETICQGGLDEQNDDS